jgi:alginate O-acetyltransferase complex protein AlgI
MILLFNSFQFGFFYIACLIGFAVLRGTPRKVFLLVASYYFYMCWSTRYIWVIWGITIIDYVAGIQIERSESASRRKFFLGCSLAANLGILAAFKYYNFFAVSVSSGLAGMGMHIPLPVLHVILPVGISFHTFQALSYTIEVYRRKAPAEYNLLNYALYVAFFPQMVAGPIERPNQLLPQFHREPHFSVERVISGLRIALWGFFKKMVIADSLAAIVNSVYAQPARFSNTELCVATVCFAIQIYCDFSGYSDIAVGLARVMGYELRINFLQPYFSRSVAEFWHRWHISLSTWFRDYLYIPLGGNRVRLPRYLVNLLITFVASGLWHGANWTFIVWGGLHGVYLIASKLTSRFRSAVAEATGITRFKRLHALIQMSITFVLVTIAWVFFRASSIGSAFYVLKHLIPRGGFSGSVLIAAGIPRANTPFIMLFVVVMFVVEWFMAHLSRTPALWRSRATRFAAYYAVAYSIIFFGVFGHTDFIYFQF